MKLNLFANVETSRLTRSVKLERWNRNVLIVSILFFVLLLLSMISIFIFFRLKLAKIENESGKLGMTYSSKANEAVRYVRVKKSLVKIGGVLAERIEYEKILRAIYQILPVGVGVVGVSFDEFGNVSFSGRAAGVDLYNKFLEQLSNESRMSEFMFSSVSEKSLIRSRNGDYNFKLNLSLSDAK